MNPSMIGSAVPNLTFHELGVIEWATLNTCSVLDKVVLLG
jgi:hypothetical protein